MFRETLPADRGMLFTFGDTQAWSFWMKNTKLPLDIIWLDPKKKIVHIERNVPVCTKTDDTCPQYRPNDGAMFVLEINGGRADALDLQGRKSLVQTTITPIIHEHFCCKRTMPLLDPEKQILDPLDERACLHEACRQ